MSRAAPCPRCHPDWGKLIGHTGRCAVHSRESTRRRRNEVRGVVFFLMSLLCFCGYFCFLFRTVVTIILARCVRVHVVCALWCVRARVICFLHSVSLVFCVCNFFVLFCTHVVFAFVLCLWLFVVSFVLLLFLCVVFARALSVLSVLFHL